MGNVSGTFSREKPDSPSLSHCSSLVRGGTLWALLPSMLECWSAWVCAALRQAAIPAENSGKHPCHAYSPAWFMVSRGLTLSFISVSFIFIRKRIFSNTANIFFPLNRVGLLSRSLGCLESEILAFLPLNRAAAGRKTIRSWYRGHYLKSRFTRGKSFPKAQLGCGRTRPPSTSACWLAVQGWR